MSVACEVQVGQYTIRGVSVGGIETCIQVPQLDLCFDVGHCPRSFARTKRLFISHGHADHAAGVVGMLALRLLLGDPNPLEVYGPARLIAALRDVVRAYESVQGHPYDWRGIAMAPGDEVALDSRHTLRAFEAVHVIETLGFTVFERVEKLKDEFKALSGAEIGRLRRAGAPIFQRESRPVLSFCGDTRIDLLDREPHLYESRVLLLESTYIDARKSVAQCQLHGHVHLDEVLDRASHFTNENIVFTHFSQAYSPGDVRTIVSQRTGGRLAPAVHVFAPDGDHWPG